MALEEAVWAEAPWAAVDLVAEVSVQKLGEQRAAAEHTSVPFPV